MKTVVICETAKGYNFGGVFNSAKEALDKWYHSANQKNKGYGFGGVYNSDHEALVSWQYVGDEQKQNIPESIELPDTDDDIICQWYDKTGGITVHESSDSFGGNKYVVYATIDPEVGPTAIAMSNDLTSLVKEIQAYQADAVDDVVVDMFFEVDMFVLNECIELNGFAMVDPYRNSHGEQSLDSSVYIIVKI